MTEPIGSAVEPEKISASSDKDAWLRAAMDLIRFTEKRAASADIAAAILTHAVFVYAVHQDDPGKALTAQIKYLVGLLATVQASELERKKG